MKILKTLMLFLALALLLPVVFSEKPESIKLIGYVNDYAGIINNGD